MKRKLISILIANLFAIVPAVTQADDFRLTGSVSVGGQHADDNEAKDASKLNEYQDFSSGLLTGIDVKGRSSTYWLDLFGENFGRDDQYIALRGGMYGSFKYKLWSDALKHNWLFDGISPYSGFGSTAHRATFPQLDPATWNKVDLGYKRRDDGGFFELQSTTPWYGRIDANQITWKGTKPGSSSQGTSPGNGFVDLGFPVDYKTRNVTVEGGYNTRTVHFDLSWMVSKFENSNENLTWTNGYFGNGIDTTYLAADNRYERIAGNASWRQLPGNTTVAARFTADELTTSVALGTQVLNSTAGAFASTGPSSPEFEGKVKNQTFTVSASSSFVRELDTKVYYNYRKRDDKSEDVTFTSSTLGNVETENFSYKTNNFGFDAYWRFNRANRLGGGYDFNKTEREGRFDFDETEDKRIFIEYKNSSLDDLAARLKYTRLERDSNFLLANSGTGTTDPNYENRYVSAFDLSNVNQDQWKLTLDWTAMPNLDFGFEGILKKNKYDQNTLGRLKDDRREVYVNVSYSGIEDMRFTVFGDHEEVKYDSQHRIIGTGTTNGAYEPAAPPNASNYNWTGQLKDRNWAAGVAIDWQATTRLTMKASAIYYKTDGYVDLALQQGVPASVAPPVPIALWDDSKRTSFNVKGIWSINKSWSFTGGYAYEKYDYSDLQFDGYRNTVPAASRQDSYLDGVYANPQYKNQIIYGLVTYRF